MSRDGRKRPSGLGSNSRKFAEVRMPDGRTLKIPQVKDAATFLCFARPDGSWPDKAESVLLYDATWMVEGVEFEVEEMRTGRGMGDKVRVRVTDTRATVRIFDGTYGQVHRLVLMLPVEDTDDLSADDLILRDLGGAS